MLAAACTIAPARAAADEARPVRADRPLLVAGALAWPWISGHDATIPLPSVRAGYSPGARIAVELTFGIIPIDVGGRFTAIDAGGRWFLRDGAISPYLMARAGDYFDSGNEGGDRSYPFATVGAGIDATCRCGLSAWFEIGPALISYVDVGPRSTTAGIYTSLGLGYRFRGR